MKLTKQQENYPYCHAGWFEGKSGWQDAKVFFEISSDGHLETMINGLYGYAEGLTCCPFCRRPLNEEEE